MHIVYIKNDIYDKCVSRQLIIFKSSVLLMLNLNTVVGNIFKVYPIIS